MNYRKPSNTAIAGLLEEIAGLLEIQHANPHRIRAYRRGAEIIRKHIPCVAEMIQTGDGKALEALPGIGERLARLIEEFVRTGKSALLQRLLGEVTPEEFFEQVPGIGHELAERLVRELDIKTLEELEQAAHDGRLARVEGFGKRRVEAIKTSLAGMLSTAARRRMAGLAPEPPAPGWGPDISTLLSVDAEYRAKAGAGELRKIAPRRFNPQQIAWLPVYHTEKSGWDLTALFSNTARAHDLKKTHDWVVIFFEKDHLEGQCTVVTETQGPLVGKRVVRGREAECHRWYEKHRMAVS